MTDRMRLHVTALSDRGLVRNNNEDSAFGGPFLLALADGMGGHAAGEVASKLMIERIAKLNQDPEDNDMLALLGASARDANIDIARHVEQHPETDGMGCTLTAMMFNGKEFGVIHAGDSRGYRLRDGKLTQITKDDTFVQSLVDKGKLAPEDVSSHPQKSLILKAYTGREVEPTLFMLDARPGDRLLLCSDGLSDPVTATTIETALGQGPIESAAETLVELALRSGGPDNVTVVVAEVVAAETADAAAPVFVGSINGELPEPTRSNSSAARAAKLNRTPQVIPPTVPSTTDEAMQETAGDPGAPAPRKRGKMGIVLASIVTVLVLVVAGGMGAKHYLSNTYYVAKDGETQELLIERGADLAVLGRTLHHDYQFACLDSEGELILKSEACEGDLSAFKVEDLPASERQVIDNLTPGSYDDVKDQLLTLSNNVLPVCLERSTAPKRGAKATGSKTTASPSSTASPKATPKVTPKPTPTASSSASASTTASPKATPKVTPKATPKFRAEPGVNCREVK